MPKTYLFSSQCFSQTVLYVLKFFLRYAWMLSWRVVNQKPPHKEPQGTQGPCDVEHSLPGEVVEDEPTHWVCDRHPHRAAWNNHHFVKLHT